MTKLAVALGLCLGAAQFGRAQLNPPINLTASPLSFGMDGQVTGMDLSSNGDRVVFRSTGANNPYGRYGVANLYVYDFSTGACRVINGSADEGVGGVFPSLTRDFMISGNGRFVAFETETLRARTANAGRTIVVRDLSGNGTTVVGVPETLTDLDRYDAQLLDISTDGNRILFAANEKMFVRDRARQQTIPVRGYHPRLFTEPFSGRLSGNGQFVWVEGIDRYTSVSRRVLYRHRVGTIGFEDYSSSIQTGGTDNLYLQDVNEDGSRVLWSHYVGNDVLNFLDVTTGQVKRFPWYISGRLTEKTDEFVGLKVVWASPDYKYEPLRKNITTDQETTVGAHAVAAVANLTPVVSSNGNRVLYSRPSQWQSGILDLYWADRLGTGARVSIADRAGNSRNLGTVSNGIAGPASSADGNIIAYVVNSTDILPGVPTGTMSVYVYNRTSGVTQLASVMADGQPYPSANAPVLSPDGTKIAFIASTSRVVVRDLVTGQELIQASYGAGLTIPGLLNDGTLFIRDIQGRDAAVRRIDVATQASTVVSTRADGSAFPDGIRGSTAVTHDGRYLFAYLRGTEFGLEDTKAVMARKDLVTGRWKQLMIGRAAWSSYDKFWPTPITADGSQYMAIFPERFSIYNTEDQKLVQTIQGYEGTQYVYGSWSSNGRWFLLAENSGNMAVIDLVTKDKWYSPWLPVASITSDGSIVAYENFQVLLFTRASRVMTAPITFSTFINFIRPELRSYGRDNRYPTTDLMYEVKLNDGPWNTVPATATILPPFDGPQTLTVRAYAPDGSREINPTTYSFVYDNVPPTVAPPSIYAERDRARIRLNLPETGEMLVVLKEDGDDRKQPINVSRLIPISGPSDYAQSQWFYGLPPGKTFRYCVEFRDRRHPLVVHTGTFQTPP